MWETVRRWVCESVSVWVCECVSVWVCECVSVWVQTGITRTDVSGSGRHGSSPLTDKLVGVKTNLDDVIEQSQERSQRECCYEDGGEAKLENCRGNKSSGETSQDVGLKSGNNNVNDWIIAAIYKVKNKHLERLRCFTHFKVFIHQSMGVHRLQIPVFFPLWELGFIVYILPSSTSFLYLPARPPVLQQTENVASS